MSETKCLLIVDDEKDFLYTVRHHFERRGYEVLEASDGKEAIELLTKDPRRINLIITDLKMPRMGGEELIEEVRRVDCYLPIIAVTGYIDHKWNLEGAFYCLHKPILDDHWRFVDRLVENAIKLHEREREIEAFRATEQKIARMLRHYILQRPVEQALLWAEHVVMPEPSNQPSGDFVECFHRNHNELLFYLADATGHKDLLPAFTVCLSNMVLHRSHHGRQPTVKELIHEIDRALEGLRSVGVFGANRFLTFFIGCLDLLSGELAYVNAGHLPVFLLRHSDGEVEVTHLSGTSLAVGQVTLLNSEVEEGSERLQPGDQLFLYSDGVTASLVEEEGEHDLSPICIRRLEEMVKPLASRPLEEMVGEVMAQLRERVGEEGFADDTTLLAIRLHKAATASLSSESEATPS